jgi:hypothetical protein
VFREISRYELRDCAELGVSELVSNAILHGCDPIQVRVRGTVDHPRVEVRDASVETPVLPAPLAMDHDDDLLLTFGRGLSIVARVSSAWGAEIDEEGKTVWFVPQLELAEGPGVQGTIIESTTFQREDPPEVVDPVEITLAGLPLTELKSNRTHLRELRRELRLLALGHEATYPLAASLSRFFTDVANTFWRGMRDEKLASALLDGDAVIDLTITVPRTSGEDFQRFIELLELADAFCRQERLLTLERTPEQIAFQTWMFGEFVRQTRGAAPLRWQPPGPAERRHQSVS